MFEEEAEAPSAEEVRLKELHAQWVDLHAVTRANLMRFERPGFRFPSKAIGHTDVKNLVGEVQCMMNSSLMPKIAFSTQRRRAIMSQVQAQL